MKASELFDLNRTLASRLLSSAEYPWDALDMLGEYINRVGRGLDRALYSEIRKGIWVAKSAKISSSARLIAPLIVGEGCEVGRLVTLGAGVILGNGASVGDGSEIKSSILFDGVRISQSNYISDSILGYNVSFGMGAIVSILTPDRRDIICVLGEMSVRCERGKFGAVVGDEATVGASSILSAGTVVERGARINPLTRARGFVSARKAYKGERIVSDILL